MTILSDFRANLEQQKGARNSLLLRKEGLEKKAIELSAKFLKSEEARNHIQIVAKETQAELEFHISDVVTSALAAVFDDPYTFNIEFVVRREKTEADLTWNKEDNQYLPNSGGVRDMSSLGLREAMRSLQPHQSAKILLLDEPFKHVKTLAAQKRALQMLKEMSFKFGLQIILVTAAESDKNMELLSEVDTAYLIAKIKDISSPKTLKK